MARETKLTSKQIYNGKVIKVFEDTVALENGNTSTREVVRHNGGVGVIAVIDGKILLVKQYRYVNDCYTLEIPAGKLEFDEEPEECGLRELEEETGYTATKMIKITEAIPTPGYCDEHIHIYLADGLEKKDNPKGCDEDEFIDVIQLDIKSAYNYVLNGDIVDMKTIVAILYTYINL